MRPSLKKGGGRGRLRDNVQERERERHADGQLERHREGAGEL